MSSYSGSSGYESEGLSEVSDDEREYSDASTTNIMQDLRARFEQPRSQHFAATGSAVRGRNLYSYLTKPTGVIHGILSAIAHRPGHCRAIQSAARATNASISKAEESCLTEDDKIDTARLEPIAFRLLADFASEIDSKSRERTHTEGESMTDKDNVELLQLLMSEELTKEQIASAFSTMTFAYLDARILVEKGRKERKGHISQINRYKKELSRWRSGSRTVSNGGSRRQAHTSTRRSTFPRSGPNEHSVPTGAGPQQWAYPGPAAMASHLGQPPVAATYPIPPPAGYPLSPPNYPPPEPQGYNGYYYGSRPL